MEQHASQLEWERRVGRPVGAAAFLSMILVVGSLVARTTVFKSTPKTDRAALALIDKHDTAFLASAVLQSLSYLAVGAVLWFLFVATRHRRPELPGWLMPLIYFGPLVLALATVFITIGQLDVAHDFVAGEATERRADALIKDVSQLPQVLGLAGSFAFAVSLVLVSLNAMRAGLLTRFLGIIGVGVGGLIVLPLVPGVREIIQIFWLGAVGAVILGFWPGGRGRAWETGEPEAWLSAAEQRRAAMREEREAKTGGIEDPPLPEPDEPDEAEPVDEGPPHPTSKKRRKKRRR
jgi:hypothetical protein